MKVCIPEELDYSVVVCSLTSPETNSPCKPRSAAGAEGRDVRLFRVQGTEWANAILPLWESVGSEEVWLVSQGAPRRMFSLPCGPWWCSTRQGRGTPVLDLLRRVKKTYAETNDVVEEVVE